MIQISRELYNKETLMKAAYAFTDEVYIHLDINQKYYLVDFFSKGEVLPDNIELRFEQELIVQQTRRSITNQTKSIREMIVARALASTIVDIGVLDDRNDSDYSAEMILKDWFDEHEDTTAT